jgi:hypothetical protein
MKPKLSEVELDIPAEQLELLATLLRKRDVGMRNFVMLRIADRLIQFRTGHARVHRLLINDAEEPSVVGGGYLGLIRTILVADDRSEKFGAIPLAMKKRLVDSLGQPLREKDLKVEEVVAKERPTDVLNEFWLNFDLQN